MEQMVQRRTQKKQRAQHHNKIQKEVQEIGVSDSCVKEVFRFIINTNRSPKPKMHRAHRSIIESLDQLKKKSQHRKFKGKLKYDRQAGWLKNEDVVEVYHNVKSSGHGQTIGNLWKNRKEFRKAYAILRRDHILEKRKHRGLGQSFEDPNKAFYVEIENRMHKDRKGNFTIPSIEDTFEKEYVKRG